jgi:hypothetical protein
MSYGGEEEGWLDECQGFETRATRSLKQKTFATWKKDTLAAALREFGMGRCVPCSVFKLHPEICPVTLKIPESVRQLEKR